MKKISELIEGTDCRLVGGSADGVVETIGFDSRECGPGSLFFCIPGFTVDGHDYIPEALTRGATTLVVSRRVNVPGDVNVLMTDEPRKAMGLISSRFFDAPSRSVGVIGVTGTNGKTTTAFLIDNMLRAAGETTGLLGTIENRVADRKLAVKRTTPESLDLQALLRMAADAGCTRATMEVSSHAVALHRIAGTEFAAGVFTNLTQDHLDFHNSLEEYYAEKKRFFQEYITAGAPAIVNVDDPRGKDIADGSGCEITSYGISNADASVRAVNVECSTDGIRFRVECEKTGAFDVESGLMGTFNAYNALATVACGISLGVGVDDVVTSLASVKGVPGRFERVMVDGQDFTLIVDYAHSPDGLLNALKAARQICRGRLIVVFGAGGDRDKAKRPLMGSVAARESDIAVVTSDNPRSEDPAEIIDQIVLGVEQEMMKLDPAKHFKHYVEIDRFAGIRRAVRIAEAGDVILVAGKGHEDYQVFRDRTIHFDDREIARNLLMEKVGN